ENPEPAETGHALLRGGHLRSHPAVLSRAHRHHGPVQGRTRAGDRLGAAEIRSRPGRLCTRLAGRARGLGDVQSPRPPRLPQGPSLADADRGGGPAPRDREETLSLVSFALLMLGVFLNASAQLLLKAGTNAVGRFEFSPENIVPIGMKLATEPHIAGGLACYVVSVVVWIMGLSRVEVSVAYPMLSVG